MKAGVSVRVRVPGGFQNGNRQSSKVPGCVCVWCVVCGGGGEGREGELGILQLRVGESAEIGLPECSRICPVVTRVLWNTCCRVSRSW